MDTTTSSTSPVRNPRKSYRTPWEHRLTPALTYTKTCPDAGALEREMTLTFESKSGCDYELEVTVFAEFEPAQRGGWTDPSWDAYVHSPVAYWFRPGHGWKEISLTRHQEEEIIEAFESRDY